MPAAAISTAGSVGSALIGSSAASKAAKNASAAGQQANNVATNVYNTNQENLNPYIQTGTNAQNALAGLLGIGGNAAGAQDAFNNYLNSTNYNFQLNQGLKGVSYQNAAQYGSGATAKALNNYAQGQAGNSLAGYESMLSGLGNTGLSAAGTLGGLGSQYASQYSGNLFGATGSQNQANLLAAQQQIGGFNGLTQGLAGLSTPQGQSGLSGLTQGISNAFQGLSSYGQNPTASSYASMAPSATAFV